MLHYACLFKKNSCKLYTYSGKFPSLKRLYSGYNGKFCHISLNNCDNFCRKYSRYLRQKIICKSRGTVPIHWGEVKHYMYLHITRSPGHILARSTPQDVKFLAPKTGQSYLDFQYVRSGGFIFLVCKIMQLVLCTTPPAHPPARPTPHLSRQAVSVCKKYFVFFSSRESFM